MDEPLSRWKVRKTVIVLLNLGQFLKFIGLALFVVMFFLGQLLFDDKNTKSRDSQWAGLVGLGGLLLLGGLGLSLSIVAKTILYYTNRSSGRLFLRLSLLMELLVVMFLPLIYITMFQNNPDRKKFMMQGYIMITLWLDTIPPILTMLGFWSLAVSYELPRLAFRHLLATLFWIVWFAASLYLAMDLFTKTSNQDSYLLHGLSMLISKWKYSWPMLLYPTLGLITLIAMMFASLPLIKHHRRTIKAIKVDQKAELPKAKSKKRKVTRSESDRG